MVFCERKRDADELALSSDIRQETHVIHGDISQDKRDMVLKVNYLGTNFQQDLKVFMYLLFDWQSEKCEKLKHFN